MTAELLACRSPTVMRPGSAGARPDPLGPRVKPIKIARPASAPVITRAPPAIAESTLKRLTAVPIHRQTLLQRHRLMQRPEWILTAEQAHADACQRLLEKEKEDAVAPAVAPTTRSASTSRLSMGGRSTSSIGGSPPPRSSPSPSASRAARAQKLELEALTRLRHLPNMEVASS